MRAVPELCDWGDPGSTRPDQDANGIITFQQFWFAGNHSDIGGSYPENESRLSDISLKWMTQAAETIPSGLKIDRSVLQLYPVHQSDDLASRGRLMVTDAVRAS